MKQRLRLASVSPKLLDVYAEDGMTLEQLMAFTVTADHARQEQVWENVSDPATTSRIRSGACSRKTPCARPTGARSSSGWMPTRQAGGVVMRDLFEHDDGGWLQDVALLDRLVTEKLKAEAETIAAEGWKWIAVAVDFPYGHTDGLRELEGEPADLTEEEQATLDALNAEHAKLESEYQDADELPDEVDAAARRDRDGAGRVREPSGRLRSGRDRPRRRLRQHRCRRAACRSSAAMSGRRTRHAGQPIRSRADATTTDRRRARRPIACVQRAVITIGGRPNRSRTRRTTPSSRCRIGSSPS